MSLASYFKKKSTQQVKVARVNLSVISDSGETKAVSLKSLVTTESKSINLQPKVQQNINEEKLDLKSTENSGNEKQVDVKKCEAKFLFGFSVNNDEKRMETTGPRNENHISNSKKRRQRQKNKAKLIQLESERNGSDKVTMGISSSLNAEEEQHMMDIASDDRSVIPTSSDIIVHSLLIEDTSETQPLTTRAPPGFERAPDLQRIDLNIESSASASLNTLIPPHRLRKTPGKKKQTKKISLARQMQLDEIERKKSNDRLLLSKQTVKSIHFNTVTQSKAMVNRSSLAVHREKSKLVGKPTDEEVYDTNPFSFGFNFNSILNNTDNKI